MRAKKGTEQSGRVSGIAGALASLALLLCGCGATRSAPAGTTPRPPGAPITMEDLHRGGGVPPGWRLSLAPGSSQAGRQAFVDFGCFSCHAIQGEQFPPVPQGQQGTGPDLTGMGSHHPAAYFAESIMNPNAVLVDGPGYLGQDGRSLMPAYPEMTLAQLADLVAYLQSLTSGAAEPHTHRVSSGPEGQASSFFVQAYELKLNQLEDFYDWFETERFRDYEGLVSVTTYAGRARQGCGSGTDCTQGVGSEAAGAVVVSVFGFTDDVSLDKFLKSQHVAGQARMAGGDVAHPVERYIMQSPPVYKPLGLSVP